MMPTATPEIAVTDTHALIWWASNVPRRLGRHARRARPSNRYAWMLPFRPLWGSNMSGDSVYSDS